MWLEYTLLDTNEYADTVAPLPSEPAVAEALSVYLVEEAVRETDAREQLETALRENLGPEIAKFSGVISASIETRIESAVADFIASDQFATLWRQANVAAHEVALAAIDDDKEVIQQNDGVVELNLKPVIDQVIDEIRGETGTDIPLPEDVGRVELFSDDGLSEVQDAARLLSTLAFVLPVLMLIAFGAAIILSRRRWRTLMQIGFGLIIVALIGAALLRFAREETVRRTADADLSSDAVGAIWDTLIRNLESQNWLILVVGAGAAAIGAVMQDYGWATSLRQSVSSHARESGAQSTLQRYAREYTGLLRGIAVAVGIGLLLLWPDPSIFAALVIVGLTVLLLAAVEYLRK